MAVAVLLALGIGILLGRYFDQSVARRPVDAVEAPVPSMDLNRADRAELALLPGLGASRARAVDEYRRQHGPFRSVEDLRNVPGIGPKTFDKLRPALFVDARAAPPLAAEPALVGGAPIRPLLPKKEVALTAPVDINHAGAAELQKLPGIKAKMAQRILDERTLRGPFKTVDELRRVSGIGVKTLAKLRPHVVVISSVEVAGK